MLYQKIHILLLRAEKFCSGAGIWAKIWARSRKMWSASLVKSRSILSLATKLDRAKFD
ncbi:MULTISPECIES: hypothetical protein [unclassified Microcoleus]|uniref:hypothetical protein n=1 Tax=unclassified Microcoleus TaxID=2642155 RepID=UPI002FD525FE